MSSVDSGGTGPGDLPEYRAILVVDAEGFSDLPSAQQEVLPQVLGTVLEAAFRRAGLEEAWHSSTPLQHTGDGYIVGLPPAILPRLVHPFLHNLQEELFHYDQELRKGHPPLRLRAAINVGPLHVRGQTGHGVGQPHTLTHRLIDSDAVRTALRESDKEVTFLAVIVSERVYADVVLGGYCGLPIQRFMEVVASAKGTRERAYIYVPQPSEASIPPAAPSTDSHSDHDRAIDRSTDQNGPSGGYLIGNVSSRGFRLRTKRTLGVVLAGVVALAIVSALVLTAYRGQ